MNLGFLRSYDKSGGRVRGGLPWLRVLVAVGRRPGRVKDVPGFPPSFFGSHAIRLPSVSLRPASVALQPPSVT